MSKKLALTINVAEDEELRNYIKELIRGQVEAIVREEFLNFVKCSVTDKIEPILNGMSIKEEIQNILRKEVIKHLPENSYRSPDTIKEMAREEIKNIIKEKLGNLKIVDNI